MVRDTKKESAPFMFDVIEQEMEPVIKDFCLFKPLLI